MCLKPMGPHPLIRVQRCIAYRVVSYRIVSHTPPYVISKRGKPEKNQEDEKVVRISSWYIEQSSARMAYSRPPSRSQSRSRTPHRCLVLHQASMPIPHSLISTQSPFLTPFSHKSTRPFFHPRANKQHPPSQSSFSGGFPAGCIIFYSTHPRLASIFKNMPNPPPRVARPPRTPPINKLSTTKTHLNKLDPQLGHRLARRHGKVLQQRRVPDVARVRIPVDV